MMNGGASGQGVSLPAGRAAQRLSRASEAVGPSGRALLEGYRKDVIGGFGTDQPRYNPLNPDRTQSSALVDLNDPIQVHLLTETALSDSKEYEILSQEEVDSLKKQIASLTQRIEQARANLAVQSKYLDAATSMARLYSPKKKNLLGGRTSIDGSAKEAEAERLACERRCEELATQLFTLEKRLMDPQRRLFQHTAGILQLTHRAARNPGQSADGSHTNGIPGSPESLYTYSNARSSRDVPPEDAFFDDRSLYMTLEQLDERGGLPRRFNKIEIPLKSPVREQANQLREEAERLREENGRLKVETDQLRATADSLQLEMDALQREGSENLKFISNTERKLEDLNIQLREVIIQFDPQKNRGYMQPPSGRLEPGDLIGSQMDYLSKGLMALQQEQRSQAMEGSTGAREAEMAATSAATTLAQAEGRIEALNRQLCDVLRTVNPGHRAPPPEMTGSHLDAQLNWLQDSLETVEDELTRAADASMESLADKQRADQMETVLQGLWDIIQTGYVGIQRRKAERRRTRMEAGLEDDEQDMSGDEMAIDPNEQYSLQAFSTKVQWLYAQATNLGEQKSVLKRQIKQQRELNNKSDKEMDIELQRKIEELQQTRALLDATDREAKESQEKLLKAQQDLEDVKKDQVTSLANVAASSEASEAQLQERDAKITESERQLRERDAKLAASESQLRERDAKMAVLETQLKELDAKVAASDSQLKERDAKAMAAESQLGEREAQTKAAQEQLEQRNAQLASLEASSRELQDKVDKVEADLVAISAQLQEAAEARKTAEASAAKLQMDVKEKEEELDRMNVMVVELKTEMTIAKAELEGAYGSRSQRAAEAAALSNDTEKSELKTQVDKMKAELAATLSDFESLTKDTIAAEREKLELEGKLDDAIAAKASMEAEVKSLREKLDSEVSRLQDRLDRERLRATPTQGSGGSSPRIGAGASMLSEQFRATMKEERKKFQEEMRAEQLQRRKLEDEIRMLKRSQGPGKSPLSPRLQ